MNIQQELDELLGHALARLLACEPGAWPAQVKPAQKPEFGHYQANGIMAAAKANRRNPRELADQLVKAIGEYPLIETAEVAGPGFINIRLGDAELGARLARLLTDPRLGVATQAAETVVIDYSSPNLAKEMHIGHLRSTTLGDCVARLLEFLGHRVIRANHVGDWGSQFGSLLAHMHELSNDPGQLAGELQDLEAFYKQAAARFREDPAFAETARAYVVRLQQDDPAVLELWRRFIATSIDHCQAIYDELGIGLNRSHVRGESAYKELVPGVVEDLERAGLLVISDGARCVFMDEFRSKDGKPLPAIVQKSDGGYPYMATDLAALKYRSRELGADRAWYFVDSRQALHLQQLFRIGQLVGYLSPGQDYRHQPNGTIMGEDGKPFKTRSGDTVKLADVIAEAKARAARLIGDRAGDLEPQERERIAGVVGIGAIKYAELSKNRTSDYVFAWDAMLSFEGNTAPYLQYAYTRIRSIFRTAGQMPDPTSALVRIQEPAERRLALRLLQFPEVLHLVAAEAMPNHLCNFLYELAGCFMAFYEQCPVLKAEADIRASRLALCALTAELLKQGLGLLGIDVVERM